MKTGKTSALRRVLRCLKPYGALLALSLLLAAGSVAGTLYLPILVGRAVDRIAGPGKVDFAGVAAVLQRVLIVAGGTAVLQWIMNDVNNRVAFRVVRDVRAQAFAHLQVLPLRYLDAHPAGELVSRVIADADTFADGLLMGFAQLFTGVLTILGTLLFMLSLDWRITLVVVVLTPLSLFTARFIARRTYHLFKEQSETRGEQTALVTELVENQKLVRAFTHEEQSLRDFDEVNGRLARSSMRATFYSSLTNPVTRFLNSVVYAGVALAGALAAVAGAVSVGGLVSFLSYANQYTKPFNEISGVVTELQNALACAGRLFELIDEPAEPADAPDAEALQNAAGGVTLEHVAFSYTKERELIRDLSLQVKPGERVAIVGPTGCGKTTLINLLMRFYDVDGGGISVDGRDVRSLTRASLRRSYGMVLQDTWLKTGTVRENLSLGRPDASMEEIAAAAKAARADSFIRRLPQGYDTVIGEGQGGLSQGQRQLLCITRVMLCLPPMLILDEATSSIDTRTEVKIQQAFDRMMEGRTSFVVAHRLSTIRGADVILVMKDGRVVEKGKHEELLQRGGFYAKLYNSQFEN
jgi:ATP-binding cassette subfamily B multidrug efflux pump